MTMREAAGQARELARRCRYLRVAAVAWKFAMRHVPKWLRRLLAVCLAIPGPFDELAALLVVAVFLAWALRSAESRREVAASVRSAWARISLPETINARMCVMLSAGFHG